MSQLIIVGIIIVVAIVAFGAFMVSRYVKVPSDKIMIIEGKGGGWVKGGKGKFIIPGIQQASFIDVKPLVLKGSVEGVSSELIDVKIDYSMPFFVSSDDNFIPNAIRSWRGVADSHKIATVKEIADGQIRSILTSMTIEEINSDRDKLASKVKTYIVPLIQEFGLDMSTINILDIEDGGGIMVARGKKAVAEAIKESEIKVAIQTKEAETGVSTQNSERDKQLATIQKDRDVTLATTDKDRAVTVATTKKEKDVAIATTQQEYNVSKAQIQNNEVAAIAEQDALREVAISEADTRRETGIAKATAEKEIQKAEALKLQTIKNAEAFADMQIGEIEAAKRVTNETATLEVIKSEAKEKSETSKVKADAAIERQKYVSDQQVQKEKGILESNRLDAEIIIPKQKNKEARIIEAEAEAEAIMIKAKAEAQAEALRIKEVAKAEAEGIKMKLSAELDTQAEGFRKMIDAAGDNKELAIQYKMIDIMPELAEKQAEAIKSMKIDSIQVWDKDNGNTTANFIENFIKGAGPALGMVNGTIKESFKKLIENDEDKKDDFGPING